ncbi:MAG: hypothetical protein ABI682_05710 [Acidobacteriota bacterium]
MKETRALLETCPCGRDLLPPVAPEGSWAEIRCDCGRRLELERSIDRWVLRADLIPEGSVPLDGFSRDLRARPDTERFWFQTLDRIGRRMPVHIVFSPSQRSAEVKQGDVKPLRLVNVATPTEARRRWLAWNGQAGATRGPASA